jgi:hypothetical protein
VSSARLRSIADQYLRAMNEDLNGWYKVRLDGCADNPCHGREMPIEVQVTEVSAGTQADYDVAVANMEGRSCVDDTNYKSGASPGMVLLYADGLDRSTMSHEGGHMALGIGDEYRETEAPSPGDEDRVREDDWSRMGSHSSYGRFVLMHRRHFGFVPAFLNRVRPGCNASLVEVERPTLLDFRFDFRAGYAGFPGPSGVESGFYLELGLDMGVPLNRLREWELILGLRGRMLAELEDTPRIALLLGIRAGLERTFTPSSGGLYLGGYGEIGPAWFNTRSSSGSLTDGAYAEGGAYLGYDFGGSSALRLRLEGAYGDIWPAAGRIVDPSVPDLSEPENMEFFRVGVGFGGRF